MLDMTHLGAETIMKRLPSVLEIGHNFANVDITREPIPVVPTIHYQMGGIPTNIHGQVVVPKDGEPNNVVNGFYAVGECACVSVHGANRLGTNSLLDLLVFGRAAGNHIVAVGSEAEGAQAAAGRRRRLRRCRAWRGSMQAPPASMRRTSPTTFAKTMQQHAGVFRTQASMDEGVGKIAALAERVEAIALADKSKVFNTARVEALEVENLIECGAGDDRLGGGAPGVPRRAHRRGLRAPATTRVPARPQRRRVDEAHAVVPRRQPARVQAGAS